MRLLFASASIGLSLVAAGCDGPGASLRIADARALRTPENRVAVEVDLVADEGLGGNIGVYCTRVTFQGQATQPETCSTDMGDGDIKTVRVVSDTDFVPFSNPTIAVRVRHAKVDVGRALVAPGRRP